MCEYLFLIMGNLILLGEVGVVGLFFCKRFFGFYIVLNCIDFFGRGNV